MEFKIEISQWKRKGEKQIKQKTKENAENQTIRNEIEIRNQRIPNRLQRRKI